MRRIVRFWCALALLAAVSGPALAQPGPPTPEERAGYVAAMQEKYPTLPAELAYLLAGQRNQFTRELGCEVYDWFAAGPEGVQPATAQRAASFASVCVLPLDGLTPDAAAAKLGDKPFSIDAEDGMFTVFARSDHMVYACCAPQVELQRLGESNYWARRIRMKDLDRAFTSLLVIDPEHFDPHAFQKRFLWNGPNAPAKYRENDFAEIRGRTESGVIDSVNLREKRKVAVYLPPGWTKEKTWPVVFVGDMGHTSFYPTVDALIEDGVIEPIIVVGVGSGWEAKVDGDPAEQAKHPDLRNGEYMPGFVEGDLFDRHLAYVSDEVTAWAAREYNASTKREESVIAGFSGGGTMALFTGLRRPDVFGYAIPLSPSWTTPTAADLAPGQRAIFHISGGVYEPDFHYNVKRFEALMREAGFEFVVEYPVSGHFPDHWSYVFANALIRFFPKQ